MDPGTSPSPDAITPLPEAAGSASRNTQEAGVSEEALMNSLATIERLFEGDTGRMQVAFDPRSSEPHVVAIRRRFRNSQTTDLLVLLHHFVLWSRTQTEIPALLKEAVSSVSYDFEHSTQLTCFLSSFHLDILLEFRTRISRIEPHIHDFVDGLAVLDSAQEGVLCGICLKESVNNIVSLTCHPSHHFHRHCIKVWLQKVNQCPVCRTPALRD